MKRGLTVFALPLALGIGACGKEPVAPEAATAADVPSLQKGHVEGTGLLLESITGVTVPLLGDLGNVVIKQAVIKEFGLERIAGNIVGLEATGFLDLTGGVLGERVVRQEFTTGVGVVSTSRGQCEIITIDLATVAEPIEVNVLGAFVDLPAAEVTGRGNGAVGSLLCALGQVAQGLVNGVTRGVRGLVDAINNLI
ncbi:MAG: hypothetical protein ABR499_02460 [Gemmatimonadaceae bacterium]